MREGKRANEPATFVETPRGIFTASGHWFHATEAMLRTYAAPVLDRTPLASLLARAEVWLRSPETVTLWLLPVFLVKLSPWAAALAAFVLYLGWRILSPAFVSRLAGNVFRWIEGAFVQGLFYVMMLSLLATQGHYAALVVGLSGFVLLRWGLMAKATAPLVRPFWASLYPLPVADQVLRALLHRTALAHRLSLPELDRMEAEVLRIWNYKKKKK